MLKNKTIGLKRNIIDKYYTKPDIVNICITNIKQYIKIEDNDLIIEPSAGNGSFIESIKQLTKNYKFYDLLPENKEIIKQDYLKLDTTKIKQEYNNIHIIGNPPFGRQSSSAIKFINKSCLFCDTLSFILPKSFKKDSLQKKIPLNFHLEFEIDLPNNSFLVENVEHDVPCVFQIWIKKNIKRIVKEKIEPFGYIFVKKNESPDISFRRVGVNAGNIYTDVENKSEQSHYFIKFTNNIHLEENIKKLNNIKFNTNNTVGPKSISTQELIYEFNYILNNNNI